MLPGIGKKANEIDIDERKFDRMKAIILSMTEKERTHPEIINPSRKKRIAAGSGPTIEDVNRLLSQFKQMQKMFKQFGGKRGGDGQGRDSRRADRARDHGRARALRICAVHAAAPADLRGRRGQTAARHLL